MMRPSDYRIRPTIEAHLLHTILFSFSTDGFRTGESHSKWGFRRILGLPTRTN